MWRRFGCIIVVGVLFTGCAAPLPEDYIYNLEDEENAKNDMSRACNKWDATVHTSMNHAKELNILLENDIKQGRATSKETDDKLALMKAEGEKIDIDSLESDCINKTRTYETIVTVRADFANGIREIKENRNKPSANCTTTFTGNKAYTHCY